MFFLFLTCLDIIEDEGARIKGRRLTLSDINGVALKWKTFNGTWLSGKFTIYRYIDIYLRNSSDIMDFFFKLHNT